ncbi:EAL domain-containing protein [Achromobacter aloeverae]
MQSALEQLGKTPYFIALQRGLILSLPLILLGAIASLVKNLPSRFLRQQLSQLSAFDIPHICDHVIAATQNIASLVVLMGFSIALTHLHNDQPGRRHVNPATTATTVFACFFITALSDDSPASLTMLALDKGLLTALIVATLGGSLFLRLAAVDRLRGSVRALDNDPLVGDVVAVLPAGVATILIFAVVKVAFERLVPHGMFDAMLAATLQGHSGADDNIFVALAYLVASQILWFFGMHGPNLLYEVQARVFDPASAINIADVMAGNEPRELFTSLFFHFFTRMGGSGSTLCLIAALRLASNQLRNRRIALLGLLPAVFNINEPLLFGLPVVLNPSYAVPFVTVPVVQALIAYIALAAGWMPGTGVDINWTMPVLFSGYAVTGSWAGVIVQIVSLAVGTAIYIPFVRAADRLSLTGARDLIDRLQEMADSEESARPQKKLPPLSGLPSRMALALANDLGHALRTREQLFLEYQPQVEAATGKVTGVEALLRWRHPLYGSIAPSLTVALAEDLDAIGELDLRIMTLACEQRAAWRGKVAEDFVMSVNITPSHLLEAAFADQVCAILDATGLPPRMLKLEITEGTALGTAMHAIDGLNRLRAAGVRIALDDFGMGQTSLNYLRQLPLDTVKLDRSLATVGNGAVNSHIVDSLVKLSHTLGVLMIVEGVEEQVQLEQLIALGCTHFQGYYFSRPLAGEHCLAFIQARQRSLPTAPLVAADGTGRKPVSLPVADTHGDAPVCAD